MSDKGFKKVQKTDCCDQKGCCPSPADTTEPQPPSRQPWWKIAVFALAIVLIAGAVTYALTTRNSAASSWPLGNGNVPLISSYTSLNVPRADSYMSINVPR